MNKCFRLLLAICSMLVLASSSTHSETSSLGFGSNWQLWSNYFLPLGLSKQEIGTNKVIATMAGKLTYSHCILKDESNRTVGGWLDSPQSVKTPIGVVQANNYIFFWPSGSLFKIDLATSVSVATPSGKLVASGLEFSENGHIRGAFFHDKASLNTPSGHLSVIGLEWNKLGRMITAFLGSGADVVTGVGPIHASTVGWRSDGTLSRISMTGPCTLKTTVGTLTLSEQWLDFDRSGKSVVGKVALAMPKSVQTPNGQAMISSVTFNDVGRLASATFTSVQRLKTQHGDLLCVGDAAWNSAGKPTKLVLAKPQSIATPLGRLKASTMELFETGSLSSINLSEPQELATSFGTILAKDKLCFDENGTLIDFVLAKPQPVPTSFGQLTASALKLSGTGTLDAITLSEPQEVETLLGQLLAKGEISLGEKGTPTKLVLAKPQSLATPSGRFTASELTLSDTGDLKAITLSEPQPVETSFGVFSAKDWLSFDGKGKLSRIVLAKPQMFMTPSGQSSIKEIRLDNAGRLKAVVFDNMQSMDTPSGRLSLVASRAKVKEVREREDLDSNPDPYIHLLTSNIDDRGRMQGLIFCVYTEAMNDLYSSDPNEAAWYPDGKLEALVLGSTNIIKSPAGEVSVVGQVSWYPDGSVRDFTCAKDDFIGDLLGRKLAYTVPMFFRDGSFRGGILRDSQKIETSIGVLNFQAIYSYPSGALECGQLDFGGKAQVGGKCYVSVFFDPSGAFLGEGRWDDEVQDWKVVPR
jgi:hypothetical protein